MSYNLHELLHHSEKYSTRLLEARTYNGCTHIQAISGMAPCSSSLKLSQDLSAQPSRARRLARRHRSPASINYYVMLSAGAVATPSCD